MALVIDDKGTITLYQGDSGEIVITGLDNTRNCKVYFAIQDKNRKPVGNELQVLANKTESVMLFLTPDFTNLLKVPIGKSYELYTYGIKVCETDKSINDTLIVKDSSYGEPNLIVVYPRKVIGA